MSLPPDYMNTALVTEIKFIIHDAAGFTLSGSG
jgi:hypothetical protein